MLMVPAFKCCLEEVESQEKLMRKKFGTYFKIFMCHRGTACSRGISFEDLRRIGICLFEFIKVRPVT
jgi:hypothetical protein